MKVMTTDEKYMARCLQLAKLGEYYVAPNPMVGALLVEMSTGNIVGEGWHRQWGGAHAEVNCFLDVKRRHERAESIPDMKDCCLYVSLEPCSHYGKTPPCAKLIIEKGVGRCVCGHLDPNPLVAGRGVNMLREAGIEVVVGVLEQECRALNKRFLCLQEKHRPYVILKWAESADGMMDIVRTEDNPGNGPIVLSNPLTKQVAHKMRAENMAIMVATHTAILDNPRLQTTRWTGRNPLRVLLDIHHRVPVTNRIFSEGAETVVYDTPDWQSILKDLVSRGVHSIIVEGGAQWLRTIMDTGIYDELHIEVAPVTIGEGVKAPKVTLPDTPDTIVYGNAIYTIPHVSDERLE